ncbi:MAG: DUF4340 domain-containing protein [Verrucomicrobiota bacterium JB022]|nr:DUF4340 domain-containing protein [Verrucomicrobiota bacterium JB022]
MRFRLTLFLLLANLVVFGTILLLEQRGEVVSAESIHRRVLPVGFIEQLEAVELSGNQANRTWTLERQDRDWWVQAPVRWPANRFALERLLDQLLHLRWETRFSMRELESSGRSLGEYGLDPAQATLVLTTPKDTLRLHIGSPTELGAKLYLQLEGRDEVLVVDRQLLASLFLELDNLVDHRVLQIHPSEVRLLSLQENGTRVRLRAQQGEWQLEAPVQAPADELAVQRAIEALYQMEAAEFVTPDLGEQGLNNPDLRIALESAQRNQSLLVGSQVPGNDLPRRRFAKLEDRDAVFTVAADNFALIAGAQETLRQKRLLSFSPSRLNTIEIRLDEQKTTLQKLENGTWQVLFDQPQDGLQSSTADPQILNRVIDALEELEAVSFVTDAPAESDLQRFGLQQPQRIVTLRREGSDQPLVLRLGTLASDRNVIYAQTNQAATVYQVRPAILYNLPLSPLFYRNRIVQTLPNSVEIRRMRLVKDATNEVIFERALGEQPSWEALEVLENEPDRTLIETLRHQLRNFEVRNYLRRGFTRPFQLDPQTSIPWDFRLEADVTQPGSAEAPTRTIVYFLSQRRGGMTQYAASPEADLVFTLPHFMIEALEPFLGPLDQARGPAAIPPAASAPEAEAEAAPASAN